MKIKCFILILFAIHFYCFELPEAKTYFDMYIPLVKDVKEQDYKGAKFFMGRDSSRVILGYLVEASGRGISGEIKVMAVISSEGTVLDYLILENNPKEPLDRLEKEVFKERCKGKGSDELKLTIFDRKNGKVEPVANAVMTCRAIVDALKKATVLIDSLPVSATGRKSKGIVTITYKRGSDGKFTVKNRTIQLAYRTAVWIEDSKGVLIKTLYRSVGGKIDPFPAHLANWEEKSGKISDNTPDTYTGATVKGGTADTSYSFTWDCKDENDKIVPDGQYTYKVEISRYYNTAGGQAPWRSGGAQSCLGEGTIVKGQKSSVSTGTSDTTSVLSSLSAKFEPK